MNFKSKDIIKRIASGISEIMDQSDFIYKKTKNEFIRNINKDYFSFNMGLYSFGNEYSLNIQLRISNNRIEDLLEKIIGKSHRITLGNTIERIAKSPDGRKIINGSMFITLIQEEDIDSAIETLERYFTTIAKPYFAKYRTLEAIDDILNNAPFEHCPADVGGNFDHRCMKGLIVSRLVDNPQHNHLVSTYDEAIKETMNTQSIENYYKVREYLMYNRIK